MSIITTFTGRQVDLLRPTPEMIHVRDIAHALSLTCRFGGHVAERYSVAQHSLILSHVVGREHALAALMHDASEAYIQDIVSPLKETEYMKGYRVVESNLMEVISQKYGFKITPEVERADKMQAAFEAYGLFSPSATPEWAVEIVSNNGEKWRNFKALLGGFPSERAEENFLARFAKLTNPELVGSGVTL